jgi:hypothetical protein
MAEHGPTRAATHSQHRAAMEVAKDAPTQHVPRHVTSHEVRAQMMGAGAMGQFNNHLAVAITKRVGTMWACTGDPGSCSARWRGASRGSC